MLDYPNVTNKTRLEQLSREFFGASVVVSPEESNGIRVYASAPLDMPLRKACLESKMNTWCEENPQKDSCQCRAYLTSLRNTGKVFQLRTDDKFQEVFAMGNSIRLNARCVYATFPF